jgi:hypothetical protein
VDISLFSRPFLEIGLQHDRIVMFCVMSTVQERYVALFGRIQQWLPGSAVIGQLGLVPPLELCPFGRVVTEPATQLGARRCIFTPSHHMQRLLFHPARPQTFHQEALTIVFRGWVIYSFDLDHYYLYLLIPVYFLFRWMVICGLNLFRV